LIDGTGTPKGITEHTRLAGKYLEILCKLTHLEMGIKIVGDCGNGQMPQIETDGSKFRVIFPITD
jgi:hypothetical protein